MPFFENSMVINKGEASTQYHLVDFLNANHIQIKNVFAPEHGFRGRADAGETIYDQKDNEIVAAGATAEDGMLLGMGVYVKGVEGDIPQ